jgi:hypothetical protein
MTRDDFNEVDKVLNEIMKDKIKDAVIYEKVAELYVDIGFIIRIIRSLALFWINGACHCSSFILKANLIYE